MPSEVAFTLDLRQQLLLGSKLRIQSPDYRNYIFAHGFGHVGVKWERNL